MKQITKAELQKALDETNKALASGELLVQEMRDEASTNANSKPAELGLTSDGSTASYYELPPEPQQLQDLISHKDMNGQIAEVFRTCYRYGQVAHSNKLREAKKIKFYADAEIARLEALDEPRKKFVRVVKPTDSLSIVEIEGTVHYTECNTVLVSDMACTCSHLAGKAASDYHNDRSGSLDGLNNEGDRVDNNF